MTNALEDQKIIREQQQKIDWLENRYKQTTIIIADAVATTLPLELQQKLYLKIASLTANIQRGEIKRNKTAKELHKK